MKNPFFWLCFAAVIFCGAYAMLHPSVETLGMLKEITIGLLVGKYALAAPANGNGGAK